MTNKKNISVIGGDSRLIYAAEYLADSGHFVSVYGSEHGKIPTTVKNLSSLKEAMSNEIILLPLPVSKNGKSLNTPLSSKDIYLKDLTEEISEHNTVFLGMGQQSLLKQIEAKAKSVCDYFTIETLTYKNALLTAEGILGIILEKLPVSVFGLKIAVTGYGRIASFLSDMLFSLGANVTVFARNELQLTKARISGINTCKLTEIGEKAGEFDCIVNTVPSIVIDDKTILNTKKDCILIESASAPYGIDFEACSKHERVLIKAFSLPGKTAPKTAGIIIGETISDCIKEVK